MKRLCSFAFVGALLFGAFALFVPAPVEAKGPTPCPLIGCGPCYHLVKVRGEKCPVCQPIPGCTF